MMSSTARRAACVSCFATLALALADLTFAGAAIELRNGTVAGGGHVVAAGDFVLIGTIAEPVQGSTSQGQFRITAGFPATIGVAGSAGDGRIFADGFED